jgi:hypothetical protein
MRGTKRQRENRQRDRQGVQTREDVCVVWCVQCVQVCAPVVGPARGVRIGIAWVIRAGITELRMWVPRSPAMHLYEIGHLEDN